MADIIVVSTITSNIILAFLLVYRGWAARLQWLTAMTVLAVFTDCCFHWIHGFAHHLYAPLRVFVVYWLFTVLTALVAFEGFSRKMKWLEYLFLIQLGLTLVALAAHRRGDPMAVYYLEYFTLYFNLFGIWYCIVKLRGQPTYEP